MLKVSAKPEENVIFKINIKVKGFIVRRFFLYSFLLYFVMKIFVSYQ